MVTLVSYIANTFGPVLGAIVWSYPVSLLPSLYFMKASGKSNQYIGKFLFDSTNTLIILFITTLCMSKFMNDNKNHPIIYPIIYSTIIWIILGISYYNLKKE